MARKEKIVIKEDPLIPTVIGVIDNKTVSMIYLVVLFVILIGFVYYLPEIETYMKSLTAGDDSQYFETAEDEDEIVDPNSYVEGMSLTSPHVTLNNIQLSTRTLSFNILNNTTEDVSLYNLNYYLEIYDEESNLINRINFADMMFEASSSTEFVYELKASDVSYFNFSVINTSMYPSVVLNKDSEGNQNLVCVKDNIVLTYYFNSNLLNKVIQIVNMDDEEYEYYTENLDNYTYYAGVSAYIEEDDVSSEFYLGIDYTKYDKDSLTEFYLDFENNTSAKIINFDLVSNGFDCN
ncbi:MAG: hypothetical protein R3Y13_04420 [bacterium]